MHPYGICFWNLWPMRLPCPLPASFFIIIININSWSLVSFYFLPSEKVNFSFTKIDVIMLFSRKLCLASCRKETTACCIYIYRWIHHPYNILIIENKYRIYSSSMHVTVLLMLFKKLSLTPLWIKNTGNLMCLMLLKGDLRIRLTDYLDIRILQCS